MIKNGKMVKLNLHFQKINPSALFRMTRYFSNYPTINLSNLKSHHLGMPPHTSYNLSNLSNTTSSVPKHK